MHPLCNTSDTQRQSIGARARQRVLTEHTAAHRAGELETYIIELAKQKV